MLLTSQLPAQSSRVWGFAGPWDPRSDATIRDHGASLDAVVTGWIGLDSTTGRPLLPSPYSDSVRPGGKASRTGRTSQRMAIVTSWHGDRFHMKSIRALGADRRRLAQTAGAIARHAREQGYTGLVLDFEALTAADLPIQLAVVEAIADSARASGGSGGGGVKTIAVAVPAGDTEAYPAKPLLAIADVIIPMLYDEHWAGGEPGPVSSVGWMRRMLAARIAEAGSADRIVAGLPTYGYRWIRGKPTEEMTLAEARRIASSAGVALSRDAASGSLRARGPGWELWVTDAVALRALLRAAEEQGVRRFALWRLGQEDPAIWRDVIR